tara:strand:- start:9916 stop:10089 length:174 start_codon:yes stop_codon:yes gene_type:complete
VNVGDLVRFEGRMGIIVERVSYADLDPDPGWRVYFPQNPILVMIFWETELELINAAG